MYSIDQAAFSDSHFLLTMAQGKASLPYSDSQGRGCVKLLVKFGSAEYASFGLACETEAGLDGSSFG